MYVAERLSRLLALAETRSLTTQPAKIVQLGPAYSARTNEIYVVDDGSIHREDTLDTLAEADLPDGDGLAHTGVLTGNHDALERLKALFFTFLDLHVDTNCVTRTKLREVLPLVPVKDSLHDRVLHRRLTPALS